LKKELEEKSKEARENLAKIKKEREDQVNRASKDSIERLKRHREQEMLRGTWGKESWHQTFDMVIEFYDREIFGLKVDEAQNEGQSLKSIIAGHIESLRKRLRQAKPIKNSIINRAFGKKVVALQNHNEGFKVGFVIDTSGSMFEGKKLDKVFSVARNIYKKYAKAKAVEVWLYPCDTEAYEPIKITSPRFFEDLEGASEEKITLSGIGGTNMEAGVQQALEDGCSFIWVFTDGDTPWEASGANIYVVLSTMSQNSIGVTAEMLEAERERQKAFIEQKRGEGTVTDVIMADYVLQE
jgi:hypothetical protein